MVDLNQLKTGGIGLFAVMNTKIFLTKGKYVLVDEDQYLSLSKHKWYCHSAKSNKDYARRGDGIFMHRFLMNSPEGLTVDHINGDSLDNRKINLRVCTLAENLRNKNIGKNNTSGFKGVGWHKGKQRWWAQVKLNGKKAYYQHFKDKEDAIEAYKRESRNYFGEFARIV